jgi:hypothetical protein
MAAPVMSHLICSMALVVLILLLPSFFVLERDNVSEQMATRELKEIADYTSNTLEHLFILANSTDSEELRITKGLIYLPQKVQGSIYVLNISSTDGITGSQVTASLSDRPWIVGTSWLVPGLNSDNAQAVIVGGDYTLEAVCERNENGFYVWIEKGE